MNRHDACDILNTEWN